MAFCKLPDARYEFVQLNVDTAKLEKVFCVPCVLDYGRARVFNHIKGISHWACGSLNEADGNGWLYILHAEKPCLLDLLRKGTDDIDDIRRLLGNTHVTPHIMILVPYTHGVADGWGGHAELDRPIAVMARGHVSARDAQKFVDMVCNALQQESREKLIKLGETV